MLIEEVKWNKNLKEMFEKTNIRNNWESAFKNIFGVRNF